MKKDLCLFDIDGLDNTIEAINAELNLLNQYKSILDKIAIISKTDRFGTITYANQHFCDVSGYQQNELIGKSHTLIRHPDMPSEVFKQMWDTLLNKQPWQGLVKNRKKDGSTYYLESRIFPIVDEKDNIQEFFSARIEITDPEQIQKIDDMYQAK